MGSYHNPWLDLVEQEERKWNDRKGATAEERIRYWAWDGNPPPRPWWRRLLNWLAI